MTNKLYILKQVSLKPVQILSDAVCSDGCLGVIQKTTQRKRILTKQEIKLNILEDKIQYY